ncbi:hypothetical protein BJ166DRAFT_616261 [Pestalotiopsis sp. NC0098]|nr:hypothetical protein BJ166DRAFT_616261 [Pestalotiopsis sp. NC0098]
MAVYDQNAKFFKSQELSDFTLTCCGTMIPVHRFVLATNSSFFRTAFRGNFKEARQSLMDFPEDDPAILEKVISIMYRGNYDDVIFGKAQHPHTVTRRPLNTICQEIRGQGNTSPDEWDTRDRLAISDVAQVLDSEQETDAVDKIFECLQDSLYIYILARKVEFPIGEVLAAERFALVLRSYFDAGQFRDVEVRTFVEFIDELYTNTPAKAELRLTFCFHFKQFCRRYPAESTKFRKEAAGVLQVHSDFRDDMARF